MIGWIKLHRKLSEKAFYTKDSEMVHLWIQLLFRANHTDREESLGGKPIICKPGQFTTGRKQLSQDTGISESKIERLLFKFENIEQQIEQRKTTSNRLISILDWNEYQNTEQQTEQQLNNDRTTGEQQLNTLKEDKELKNENKLKKFIKPEISEISDYCIERNNGIDANYFFDYYESNGWMVGRTKMKDWKSTIRNWERNNLNRPKQNGTEPKQNRIQQAIQLQADVEQMIIEQQRINDLKNG